MPKEGRHHRDQIFFVCTTKKMPSLDYECKPVDGEFVCTSAGEDESGATFSEPMKDLGANGPRVEPASEEASASACQKKCAADASCQVFSYNSNPESAHYRQCTKRKELGRVTHRPGVDTYLKTSPGEASSGDGPGSTYGDEEKNTNYAGQDVSRPCPSAKNLAACRDLCTEEPRCKGISFDSSSGACCLKEEVAPSDRQVKGGVTSLVKKQETTGTSRSTLACKSKSLADVSSCEDVGPWDGDFGCCVQQDKKPCPPGRDYGVLEGLPRCIGGVLSAEDNSIADPKPSPPTEPGCWVLYPNDCTRIKVGANKWIRDAIGETTKFAAGDRDVCMQTRKKDHNLICGINDADMHWNPPATPSKKPEVSGCHFLLPAGCPKKPLGYKKNEWARDVWGEEHDGAKRDQTACEVTRKKEMDAFCGISDGAAGETKMLFVPAAPPPPLPTEPGCYYLLPTGCGSQHTEHGENEWRGDTWGMLAKKADESESTCVTERKKDWNEFCKTDDAKTHFVPPLPKPDPPKTPGCYYLYPQECNNKDAARKNSWQRDTYGEQHIGAGRDENLCKLRAIEWKQFCRGNSLQQVDVEMVFNPATGTEDGANRSIFGIAHDNGEDQLWTTSGETDSWTQMDNTKKLAAVATDREHAYGVTKDNRIYTCQLPCTTNHWRKMSGPLLSSIDAGGDTLYGVDKNSAGYRYDSETKGWKNIPGTDLRTIDGKNSTMLWATTNDDKVLSCAKPCEGGAWKASSQKLKSLSVDEDNVWGVTQSNQLVVKAAMTDDDVWTPVPNAVGVDTVSAFADDEIWMTNLSNEVFHCKKPCEDGGWVKSQGAKLTTVL